MHGKSWMAALLCCLATAAYAETLYKLIDKKGKVTYAQEKPKDFDGQVIPLDIDLKANTATLPKFTPPPPPPKPQPGAKASDPVAQARARVDDARRALERARDNPGPDDVRRVGNVGGGTRPVFSDAYLQRLASLEADLKEAQDDLRKLERGR
jgi:hypothetical protein